MSKKERSKPLVDKKFLLQKFNGKGGWTYVTIPKLAKSKKDRARVKVKGTIDGYKISKFHLMPMGDGRLMLPVKAEIRKKIKKESGSRVHIILYPDHDKLSVPAEMMACLKDEPAALKFFNALSESEKKYYIQWVYAAKRVETKVTRMTNTIDRLSRGLKMYTPIKRIEDND